MSLSATLFGRDSIIFKATNIMGLGIPGLLDKWFGAEGPPAQRLGEISQQTAKEAEPRVIVFGRVRPIGGNLMHCQSPVKRMIKVKTESGGKGGGKKKQTQKVEHVFRTYAIGVCEGPITAFVRVWRNNKLVYDARGNDWGEKNNPVFLKSFQFYTGAWNQLPSPALEKIWGVGNVPAYRGTAYMVSVDEDLTDTGGMVPQWQFEVERAEYIAITSKLYGVLERDAVSVAAPVPMHAMVRTMVHRAETGDVLSAPFSLPAEAVVRSSEQRTSTLNVLTVVNPQPSVATIETAIKSASQSDVLMVGNPRPVTAIVTRAVVRTNYNEILSVVNPQPSIATVTTQ